MTRSNIVTYKKFQYGEPLLIAVFWSEACIPAGLEVIDLVVDRAWQQTYWYVICMQMLNPGKKNV